MKVRVLGWAFGISFLGSLPAGVLNVSVAGLVLSSGWVKAAAFGIGAIIAEVLVVFLSLVAASKLVIAKRYHHYLGYAIIALLFFMAASSISAALKQQGFETQLPGVNEQPFFAGLFLSIINPFHLPFWLGWTVVLRAKRVLPATNVADIAYLVGIATGTAAAFLLYGVTASKVATLLEKNQYILNWIIGISLLIGAVVQLVMQIKSHNASKKH